MYFSSLNQAWMFADKMGNEQEPLWLDQQVSCGKKLSLPLSVTGQNTRALRTNVSIPNLCSSHMGCWRKRWISTALLESSNAKCIRSLEMCVDFEEKYACKQGLFVINWAQNSWSEFCSHCLQRPFTHAAFQGKVTDWAAKPPALSSCHLSWLF